MLRYFPRRWFSINPPAMPQKGHLMGAKEANKVNRHLDKPVVGNGNSELKISHNFIPFGQGNKYLLNLSLDANTDIVKPATFVCALDISGSMDGTVGDNTDQEISKFSRWDLVKHSMNIIVSCLRPEDQLALVTFSNDANRNLDLTHMTVDGKQRAHHVLNQCHPNGGTNLWAGLKSSLDLIIPTHQGNKFSLILTDGEPNINPPRGIYHEFLSRYASHPSALHTFGYGYSLDSDLLYNLASSGAGGFYHIPDYSMCNTVFINYLSNCLATVLSRVDMEIKGSYGLHYGIHGLNNNNILPIGAIQSGQTRNIILSTEITHPQNFELNLAFHHDGKTIPYSVTYNSDIVTTSNYISYIAQTNLVHEFPKMLLCEIIRKGLTRDDHSQTLDELDHLIGIITELKNYAKDKVPLDALIRNIKHPNTNDGQIWKAFSKSEWFNRWGIHYLKYMLRSYQLQICSNFKDASLQFYGGQLFREIRTEVEDIFSNLPVPQPSLSNQPFTGNFKQSTYTASGPCFDGKGIVQLSNDHTKYVKDLIAGDYIRNSNGDVARIVCVIKTTISGGATEMVNLDGFRVTPWHPVRLDGKWYWPCDLKEPMKLHCTHIYNFVLDQHHIITIDGVDAITLGHNITDDPILKHPFFGSQKVIDHLKTHPGWHTGLIELDTYNPSFDDNRLICGFF